MICKLSFLAPLFLLKQQQAACSGPLKKGRKTFTSGLNVCGKWCFGLRQMKDFVCQVLTLTVMATAKAHVSYLLIKSHSSGALAASLREWSTKKATALKSGIESGTCLACLWKKGGKGKRSMLMRLLNEAAMHTWLLQSTAHFPRKLRVWCFVSWDFSAKCFLSFRVLPISLHTNQLNKQINSKIHGEDIWKTRESPLTDNYGKDLKWLKGNSSLYIPVFQSLCHHGFIFSSILKEVLFFRWLWKQSCKIIPCNPSMHQLGMLRKPEVFPLSSLGLLYPIKGGQSPHSASAVPPPGLYSL